MPRKKDRPGSRHSSNQSEKSRQRRVSRNVRRLREERKWTQWQLARISRLSERTIQRVEGGGPQGVTAQMALAAAFEIELSELYQDDCSDSRTDFQFLQRITSGQRLIDLLENADAARFETDNPRLKTVNARFEAADARIELADV